jgi:DNA-binding MarR family transcriptional regulator
MKPKQTGPSPRYSAFLRLLRTADTLWNASRIYLARWDLSPSQFNILNLAHSEPNGMSQIELGRRLLMHRSNVTGLVDRLEKRGLVTRQTDSNDRRVYQIILTKAGRKLIGEILPHYYQDAEQVWGQIDLQLALQIVESLETIGSNAERIAEKQAQERRTES